MLTHNNKNIFPNNQSIIHKNTYPIIELIILSEIMDAYIA